MLRCAARAARLARRHDAVSTDLLATILEPDLYLKGGHLELCGEGFAHTQAGAHLLIKRGEQRRLRLL